MPKLSKVIADAGVTSRRKAAELIRGRRVRIDGEVVTDPARDVDARSSRIEVDGRTVVQEPKVYLLLNKPRGVLSTVTDQRGRPTVLDLLHGVTQRVYPAGRLDADTEGLLLITNDGDLALHLTHPRYGVDKVYEVEVRGKPSRADLLRLEKGVTLEDGPARCARARLLTHGGGLSRLELTLHSGRKRQVRRMMEAINYPVLSLRRTQLGPLTLGRLSPGRWRKLAPAEVARLRAAAQSNAAPQGGGSQANSDKP
jgi:23S rRNA pseudouridine2605 synthase